MPQELPAIPPPSPPRPPMGSKTTLLAGCGLGCAVMFVVIIAVIVGASFALPSLLRPRAREVIAARYEKAQENKNLSKRQLEVYDELVAETDYPQVNGLAAMTSAALLHEHLKDGTLTDEEIDEARVFLDFLQQNPNVGMWGMMQFHRDHPEIEAKMRAFQSNPANLSP